MTKITLSADKKQLKEAFLDLLIETHDDLTKKHIDVDIIIPHICGMVSTAEWLGILDKHECAKLISAIAVALDDSILV